MSEMPKIGDVFLTNNLGAPVIVCYDITESSYGVHYEFYVLEHDEGVHRGISNHRSWMQNDDFESQSRMFGDCGMRKAMRVFKFLRLS